VDGETTESNVPGEGRVFFDLRAKTVLPDEYRTPMQVLLHINLEAQKEYRPGYPVEKRGIYYIARIISSQIERVTEGTSYAGIQKVYSIWICLGKDIPVKEQQTITRFHLIKEDLVGEVNVKEENFDLLELIVIHLGDKETEDKLLGMLTTLLWEKLSARERMRKLEKEYGIPMEREVVEEVGSMCSYSAAIKEREREEGKVEGRTEGIAKAICILLESMGEVSLELEHRILAEQNTEVLENWLRLAKRTETVWEFCEKACI